MDTQTAAAALRDRNCQVILVLGGDGTNRAVASAWPDAPLIAVSTGTNNVFPSLLEATVAGAAAGLVASGCVRLSEVARQRKRISVQIEGEQDDMALIDAVHSSERFIGSRALLSPESLRTVVLTRADPAAVGMTALGGLLDPMTDDVDAGQVIDVCAGGITLNAPLAPGYYRPVPISAWRRVALGVDVPVTGPGVLAFDGERERVLRPGQAAHLSITRTGPHVIDVAGALELGARRDAFRLDPGVTGNVVAAFSQP
jgi:predicted polyphosphate/ATP-dependent NAD kinase